MRKIGHRKTRLILAALLTAAFVNFAQAGANVLVEAEGFKNRGGWVVDQQFMDQMGSPFLMAHGLGQPVADAETTVEFPATGRYRLWVRTRDWVAPWKSPGAPGKFNVLVDGKKIETLFGVEGAEWHWQAGGEVVIAKRKVALALRDLTGFNGRCDALLFSSDPGFTPPTGDLTAFRKKALGLPKTPPEATPTEGDRFDLVVVGGGIAGTCTAISAARQGLKVALIQNRPLLGGNNSSEVRVHLGGKINLPPYPGLGNVVKEIGPKLQGNAQPASNYEDEKKLRVVRAEKNITLFLNWHVFQVEKKGDRIAAVVAKHIENSRELRFAAPLFADCTGDGSVGFRAGADWRMGREGKDETEEKSAPEKGDAMTMGASVQWYSLPVKEAAPFPATPWAVQFTEESAQHVTMGEWSWETGMHRDQIGEFEFIRDYALRVNFGNWSFLKNRAKSRAKYAKRKLGWVAYIGGKRESRRLMGDKILQEQDIVEQRRFPDSFVTATWSIDLHYPNAKNSKYFPGEEFRSIAIHGKKKDYPIPYRCLYSRNVPNLMMAGRNISVTHVALGTVRVMRTTGMMGELIGLAASLCAKHDTTPQGVYRDHLEEFQALALKGVQAASK